jgi:hypothetical protein
LEKQFLLIGWMCFRNYSILCICVGGKLFCVCVTGVGTQGLTC